MVRLIQLPVFNTKREQFVQSDVEPLHVAAAPGVFIISTLSSSLNVYKSGSEPILLYQLKTKNKEIWDLQYSQFDDSLLTLENESDESAIRVVRHYSNWRSPDGKAPEADAIIVHELSSNRSVTSFTIDASNAKASRTKEDAVRRLRPYPYFQILVYTDALLSLYRVRCDKHVESTSDDMDLLEDPHFLWVFSIKANAELIGLCGRYLSYSTTTEVFLVKYEVEQMAAEAHSLSKLCTTAIGDGAARESLKHHSLIMEQVPLKNVKKFSNKRGSSSLSRNSSMTGLDKTLDSQSSAIYSSLREIPLRQPSSSNKRDSMAADDKATSSSSTRTSQRNSVSAAFTSLEAQDSVELSKHHMDIVFNKTNGIKNKVPYMELPLDAKKTQVIGNNAGITPASTQVMTALENDSPSQIVGPIKDVHAYVVNTDEDFVIVSSQLLFYHNFGLTAAKNDEDDFMVLSGAIPASSLPEASIHSLSLLPVISNAPQDLDNNNQDGVKRCGVRLFVSSAYEGHIWMFKQDELCDTATYDLLNACYKTIVTDIFIYSFTIEGNTVLIHLMRDLDAYHSGQAYQTLKGEGVHKMSKPPGKRGTRKSLSINETSSSSGPRQNLDSKTLIQQTSDPLLVGAFPMPGLMTVCVNTDGTAIMLCKSTEDQIHAMRDASLGTRGNRRRTDSASSPLEHEQETVSRRRSQALGWKLIYATFSSVSKLLEQFSHFIGTEENITNEESNILVENFNFCTSLLRCHAQHQIAARLTSDSTPSWLSEQDVQLVIGKRRALYATLASLECEQTRLFRAAILWSLSDVPAEKAIEKLMNRMKKDMKDTTITTLTQASVVEYLTRTLLGPMKRMDLIAHCSDGFADVVYAILVIQNPSLVGQMVLESPLNNFSLDDTIVLLEKTMGELEEKVWRASTSVFFNSAVIIGDLDDDDRRISLLDDFYSTQTMEERQLWVTTLALIVLLQRRENSSESLMAQRSGSFKGQIPVLDAEAYLSRLPETFLVPYLATHSHLMFASSERTTSSTDTAGLENTPSTLARLLAHFSPWTCLEVLVVAGPSRFPLDYVADLLGKENLPKSASSLLPRPPQLPPILPFNPTVITTYYEAQLMLHMKNKKDDGASTDNTKGASRKTTQEQLPDAKKSSHVLDCIHRLLTRYIEHLESPSDVLSNYLNHSTPDLVLRLNPHNTEPPMALEGIWKEFHREYFIDARYKFLSNIPPQLPANYGMPLRGNPGELSVPNHFYLFKLQGLLCTLADQANADAALAAPLQKIISEVTGVLKTKNVAENVMEAISMLLKPLHGDFQHAIAQLVQRYPASLTHFLKKYLNKDDLSRWKITIDVLLLSLSDPKHEADAVWCLEEVLRFMARNLSSTNFLNILPANGNLAFFIPYIELNLGRNASMELLAQLQALK